VKNDPDLHEEIADSDAGKIQFVALAVGCAGRDFERGLPRIFDAIRKVTNPNRQAASESRIFGVENRVDI
jgi:hypothetical protein